MPNAPIDILPHMSAMQVTATVLFGLAVLHTFMVKKFMHLAKKFPEGSIGENFFHFLGEVEVVFGIWAGVFLAVWTTRFGSASATQFMESINFTEAAFVFVIMCMAATRPIMEAATNAIDLVVRALPLNPNIARFCAILILGPIMGSFITEPAAMTVCALLLKRYFFDTDLSARCKYATLGLLFVNISIGGTLTNFAAPPVLMVAGPWNFTTPFMLANFGWKAALAVTTSTIITAAIFSRELKGVRISPSADSAGVNRDKPVPLWGIVIQTLFIGVTVFKAHHMAVFVPVFLFFIGWVTVTQEFQSPLKIRESLLVGFFLGGLVTLGKLQEWWLKPLLAGMDPTTLFFGATALTAVTDNAALTYLGTLVPNLSDAMKYALVAGAVTGGGLTVIANAPNPAGFGILQSSFGDEGISPLGLLLGALGPTLIAIVAFLLL